MHILLARNYELIGGPQTAPDLDLSLDQISHLNPAPEYPLPCVVVDVSESNPRESRTTAAAGTVRTLIVAEL